MRARIRYTQFQRNQYVIYYSALAKHELYLILGEVDPESDMFDAAERAVGRVGVSVSMGAGGIVMVSCTPSNIELGF